MRGHIDLFEFLLMKGANPMARDHIGKTALEYIKNDYATVTSAPKTA
jgi:ankyrin repeat protein